MDEDPWLAVFDGTDNTGDDSETFDASFVYVFQLNLEHIFIKSNEHTVCLVEKRQNLRYC